MKHLKIPTKIEEIMQKMKENGFETFIVGGCVRDLLLNREPKDWDITTNATPEEILKIFPDSFYENDFGTVGVKTDSENTKEDTESNDQDASLKIIEITPYRIEGEYSDSRHPDKVTFSKNIEDDLKRRDFTVNAIAYNKDRGIVDLFNGLEDLRSKVIRTVGNPDDRFKEDALRLMRAIRLATQLDFIIDQETFQSIYNNSDLIKNISAERVRDEFIKLILSENPIIGMAMLEKSKILSHIMPELQKSVGVLQNKEAHKYDVWEHLLRSLQHAADKDYPLEIRLSALFHDIAKPHTKRVSKSGGTTFYGHEVVGAKLTKTILERLRFPKETTETVTKMVRWHMFFADPDEISLTAVRRMIARVGKELIWDLMNLRICDRIGTGRPKEQPYRFRKYKSMVEEALRDPISVKMLKINGEDLQNTLGIKPGPKIGQILSSLFDDVLEDPTKNNIDYLNTRALELNNLEESELEDLAKKGKEKISEKEGEALDEIRKKHNV